MRFTFNKCSSTPFQYTWTTKMITWGNHSKAQQELEGKIWERISQSYNKFRLWLRLLPGPKTQTGQSFFLLFHFIWSWGEKLVLLSCLVKDSIVALRYNWLLNNSCIFSAGLLYLIQLLNSSEVSLRGDYNYACVTLPQDAYIW